MRTKNVSLRSRRDLWVIAIIVLLAIGMTSCGKAPEPTPVPPTDTPVPPTDTPEPTPTRTERPTWTPQPTATEILATATPDYRYECIPFEILSQEMVGEEVCVYGEIVKWTSGAGYAAVYRFAEEEDFFLVRSLKYYIPGYEEGDCIGAVGEIQWNGSYYFIEFGEDRDEVIMGEVDYCN
jgi:hypothetical protein